MATRYKGFSSHEFVRRRTFSLTDIELVKMDLLNYIYTNKRNRLVMPWFGTDIMQQPFEPNDDITMDIIREDLLAAIKYDPRVKLISLNMRSDIDNHTITAEANLWFVELNMSQIVYLNISSNIMN